MSAAVTAPPAVADQVFQDLSFTTRLARCSLSRDSEWTLGTFSRERLSAGFFQ